MSEQFFFFFYSETFRLQSCYIEEIQDTHRIVSAGDPAEEDEVCDEEAHAQMKMNAVSGPLDGAAEPERQDTEK